MNKTETDYQIALHTMCREILRSISKFKKDTGRQRVSVETSDYHYDEELNEGTGKFIKSGNKLGITVYIGEDDSDYNETGDDDDE